MGKPITIDGEVRGAAGAAAPHESAELHVSGEATYVDDIAELAGTLHAALGLSERAHARVVSIDFAGVRAAPGMVAVFTANDIEGENNCGPIAHDDPILADQVVRYVGQPVFAQFLDQLVARTPLVVLAYRGPDGHAACTDDEHSAIAEAIASGAGERASRLMSTHLDAIASQLRLVDEDPATDLATIFADKRNR